MSLRFAPFVHVASCTWFLYDYVLNLDEEVQFIWFYGRRRSPYDYAYFVIKIATLIALIAGLITVGAGDISGQRCKNIGILMGTTGTVVTVCADVLLIIRVHLMFNCNRQLLLVNSSLYALVCVSAVTIDVLEGPSPQDFVSLPSPSGSCHVRLRQPLAISWILGAIYHAYLTALVLVKYREAYTRLEQLGHRVSMLRLLVDGNIKFFFTVMISYAATTSLTCSSTMDQDGAYNLLTTTTIAIFASKLIRNLRHKLHYGNNDPDLSWMSDLGIQSSIMFATPGDEAMDLWDRRARDDDVEGLASPT
ncbi:hypothetical protein EXIGLDRAFT_842825 [Exidia glandulosa HHB12029]|uniref:DUF6533 domain-containing protein n=1 Tax=Exidia glandulosa HHB12029 TaxID=1314781 RepID=A0A165ZKV6_EXIGL|nr:hypothetical protein EXIGLDRAFT_842825 [Exidia glandulosa HHB12029]